MYRHTSRRYGEFMTDKFSFFVRVGERSLGGLSMCPNSIDRRVFFRVRYSLITSLFMLCLLCSKCPKYIFRGD